MSASNYPTLQDWLAGIALVILAGLVLVLL